MDLDNSRAAVGSGITSHNVSQLRVGWARSLPGAGALSTVPLVVDGIVYLQSGFGQVFAIDS